MFLEDGVIKQKQRGFPRGFLFSAEALNLEKNQAGTMSNYHIKNLEAYFQV